MDLLGRGTHIGPRHGCNVLELASVLAGERWSSSPQSVHPALATAAESVNDLLTDDRKRLLVPLAQWLSGTNSADPRIWPAVASACIRAGLASAPGPDQPRLLAELNRFSEWLVLASSASGGRRGYPTRRRHRRRVMDASRRRLAGEGAVDPLLPLADTGYADGRAGRGDPTATYAFLNPASAAGRGSRQSGNPQRAFRVIPGLGGSGWRVCVRSGVKITRTGIHRDTVIASKPNE
jgi:hypothetical protein